MPAPYRGFTTNRANTYARRMGQQSRFLRNLRGRYQRFYDSQRTTQANMSNVYSRQNNPYARQQAAYRQRPQQEPEPPYRPYQQRGRRPPAEEEPEPDPFAGGALPWWHRLILSFGRWGTNQYNPNFGTQMSRTAGEEPTPEPNPRTYQANYGTGLPNDPRSYPWIAARQRQNAAAYAQAEQYQAIADQYPYISRTMIPSYMNTPGQEQLVTEDWIYPEQDWWEKPPERDPRLRGHVTGARRSSGHGQLKRPSEVPRAGGELDYEGGYSGYGGGYPGYGGGYPGYGGGGYTPFSYPTDQRPTERQAVPVQTVSRQPRGGGQPYEPRGSFYRKRLSWMGI